MTTIAWDGDILASDTLSTSGNMILSGEYTKLKRIGSYRIALAGDTAPAVIFINEISKKIHGDEKLLTPEKPSDDHFTVILIEDNKKVCHVFNSQTGYWDEFNPPLAIGSGSQYALGALLSGKTAEEAILIACQLDTHTAPPIQIEE